jgi:hypothetical protein
VARWVASCEPWRSTLWILQDDFPIWCGPITGQPHQTILDGQLPIQAATVEEMFNHRQVSDNVDLVNLDVFEIFRAFLVYALQKTPNGNIAGTGRYANTSGIVDHVAYSGVIASVQLAAASFTKVYQTWNDLVSAYSLEFTLAPAMADPGSFFIQVQLGLPQTGRPYSVTGLTFTFPSYQFIDYAFLSSNSTAANRILATGSGTSGSTASYVSDQSAGTATAELNAGYPLLEDSASYSGTVTSQAQINGFAAGEVAARSVTASRTPTFTFGADAYPRVRDVQLGDECAVALTSPLHPATPSGGPGFTGLLRITGWSITPPSQGQPEQIIYQLGSVTPTPAGG